MNQAVDFIPLNDMILVKPIRENQEFGGLVPADTSMRLHTFGKVLKVGPGRFDEGMSLKEGDLITFPEHAYREVKLKNETLIVMNEKQVFGKYVTKDAPGDS